MPRRPSSDELVGEKVLRDARGVNQGGQAIVGNVAHPGGGVAAKFEDQPHAEQIGNAPQQTMPSHIEAEREAVPVTGGQR